MQNHGGRRGLDRIVVGFTTSYGISAYLHKTIIVSKCHDCVLKCHDLH
jgi:hypothetical protein